MVFSHTAMADKPEYQIGGGLMYFNYAEYNNNNVFLDGETGFIPGILHKLKISGNRVYGELVGKLYGNTINYDGQTQSGTPVKTNSIAIILDVHFKLGFNFSRGRNHGPYTGLGYRYWYRKILSGRDINGNPVAGLLEEYYWYYGLLGYAANFNVSEKVKVGFDIRHTQMINAKMDVNFLGYNNYDNTQVNLGNESGLRLAFPIKVKMRKHSLIVSPYYEIIDIGKSNSVGVTIGGAPTATVIYEPRSETRNVGIEITWLW